MPYTALQRMLDESAPEGMQGHFEASFMDGLPDAAIDELVRHGERIVSPLTHVLIHALSMWADPADTPLNRAWSQGLVDALAPHSRRGTHPNHVSSDRRQRVRSFYGDDTYERLVAVKDRWDPENVFSRNQNIRPSRD